MSKSRRNWSREELIVTFNLYCKLPFSKINYRHELVIKLANAINRTPSAVAWKLVNFASLDPSLRKEGIKGATNVSKLDRQIFNEFTENWEELILESEKLLNNFFNLRNESVEVENSLEGLDKFYLTKSRINQSFFRKMILSSYNNECCLTGLDTITLLVASHIVPWSNDSKNRLNPHNGLCLNYLHDRAFDKGLITFDEKYKLLLSLDLKKSKNKSIQHNFQDLESKPLKLPGKFLPSQDFLEFHRNTIFKG
ncbi:HNH endonuclease [Croceibacter atlanticus]|uniref:HNH endonuclease n=1 Tax=Croceibacter atlanticus TaxID=313588 RepID=UPI0030D81BC9|tara:strand:+ start:61613 stop:62371 length:759 start_codon:yes stop_codon:yes gene_type:complete